MTHIYDLGRRALFVPALGLVLAAAGGSAFAHAALEVAEPAAQSHNEAVREVRLRFNERIEGSASYIRIEDAQKHRLEVPAAQLDAGNPRVLVLRLKEPLAPGEFHVRWAAVADDGHRSSGEYSFHVAR